MEQEVASCSTSSISDQANELTGLTLEQGINVWGTNQQVLEEQALQELDIFAQKNTINNVEDGEIIENKKQEIDCSLDINTYIKRQEELRKIQAYQRTLQVTDRNKLIADKISKQQKIKLKRKSNNIEKNNQNKKIKLNQEEQGDNSGSEYVPSEDSESEQIIDGCVQLKKKKNHDTKKLQKFKDDGCLEHFKSRLEEYYKRLENENCLDDDEVDSLDFYTIKGGLKIPFRIWNNLYSYQQDGVRWLWKIHEKSTGGLLGDEMGLGKTVQVIAFLAGLEYTQVVSGNDRFKGLGPTLIVCPVTVIHQWVKHFHDWAPEFRVAILHQSGSYQGSKTKLIKEIYKSKGILVTSYIGILKYKESLTEHNWHYLILDEGHKIRNPNAKVSVAIKMIKTPHRLMLTGSPMQNNLQELWSLFDFTNPGMLGNLTTFMEHFNNPIVQGGFINATPMQEATALSVATTLKNVITPFLLRRSKNEVQHHISLPNKSEQSDHVGLILGKESKNWFTENQTRANVFIAITTLRKICNHPDIYLYEADEVDKDSSYDVFLLTTRVGGLGVNLTGADRVIIYDPDWNPATDTQARERAWRIGQDKEVTIYRLISAGTIEEKMYQRQVWKQLLSNKVLLDPKTHRFFKSSSLHDLFSLPERSEDSNPETTNIFRDSRVKIQERLKEKRKKVKKEDPVQFSEDKIQEMKNLAQQIAKSIAQSEKTEIQKTPYQVELEEERRKKLEEKEELKKLTPVELMYLNREKAQEKPESRGNRVDDCETDVSFSTALEYSETNAKLYNELKREKIKNFERKEGDLSFRQKHKKSKREDIFKSVVDNTGTVDGEKVDGLLKTEIKKVKKNKKVNQSESQDQYVLEKLFSKKGVSGALQHDSIVNSNVRKQSLKVQTEAKLRADKALEALRKSRLNNWRW
ncbi:DNA excision repair protein ERCC-6-like [Asbolus verrucosus]|uniref:DNA repair and recombination protein RAD54-like n=1 Tax=Asbolus verrucosus TaxID=1661398 RepID=A0A482VRG2_ASBVE|nr:DNA excision repair protein ERCC-6-like [Asbolus verrucosus]